MVEILCVWEYTVFSGDNGFTVCRYRNLEKGSRFVASGYGLPTQRGAQCRLWGQWKKKDQKWTFMVEQHQEELPSDLTSAVEYLQSLRCGISAAAAKLLYNHFGPSLWQVLEKEPEKLRRVKGCGSINLDKLISRYRETVQLRNLLSMFQASEPKDVRRIQRMAMQMGPDAEHLVRSNPYLICDYQFSFQEADQLALRLDYQRAQPIRTAAAVISALRDGENSGHMFLEPEALMSAVRALISQNSDGLDTSVPMVCSVICMMQEQGLLKVEDGAIYRMFRYQEEVTIAFDLMRINGAKSYSSGNLEKYITQYERKEGITLAKAQKDAVTACFSSSVHVITGGPGTGKTTILKAVLYCHRKVLQELQIASEPLLMAPTGRAARRMTVSTEANATTIHKALGIVAESDQEQVLYGMHLSATLVIVDEASMVGSHLAAALFGAIPTGAQLVIVGDTEQLPSVGCGNVLHEIIASGAVSVTMLTAIFRQAEGNSIISNAQRIRDGNTALQWTDNFAFVYAPGPEHVYEAAAQLYCKCVSQVGLQNVMLLNPYRNKGFISALELNHRIQEILNPARAGENEMKCGAITFRKGDLVMQTRNTDIVANGDTGIITDVFQRKEDRGKPVTICRIHFSDGLTVEYARKDMEHVTLAYCATVHKSQGSEYDTVLLVLHDSHWNMLRRNLIYTGITRAINRVAVIGTETAVEMAIQSNVINQRNTKLAIRIKEQNNSCSQ